MADSIHHGCFPIEVLYENEKYPTLVEKYEQLQRRPFSVLRTRVKLLSDNDPKWMKNALSAG